jgi:hypothetical protein
VPKTKSEFVGRWALACTKTEVTSEHRNAVVVQLAAVRVRESLRGKPKKRKSLWWRLQMVPRSFKHFSCRS